jgi:hypothetical protein
MFEGFSMQAALQVSAVLSTAFLFGGMLLYAGGFAAFLFTAMPIDQARGLIRKAFPHFYVFVILVALVAAGLMWPIDRFSAIMLGVIALSTIPTRQVLMPAINRATDAGQRKRFGQLHGLSVVITLAHIAMAAVVLGRVALR